MTKPHLRTRVCGHLIEAKRRNYYNPEDKYRIVVDGIIIVKVKEKDLKKTLLKLKMVIRQYYLENPLGLSIRPDHQTFKGT